MMSLGLARSRRNDIHLLVTLISSSLHGLICLSLFLSFKSFKYLLVISNHGLKILDHILLSVKFSINIPKHGTHSG